MNKLLTGTLLMLVTCSMSTVVRGQDAATQFFQNHSQPLDFQISGDQILLANSQVGIGFRQEADKFFLTRFYGIASGEDFLSSVNSTGKLWQLTLNNSGSQINLASDSGADISSSLTFDSSGMTLKLKWAGVDIPNEPGAIDVEISVGLSQSDPQSRWRINVTNRSNTYGLQDVTFPTVSLKPIGNQPQKNYLSVPWGRGIEVPDPFDNLPASGPLTGGVTGNWGEYPSNPRVMQFQSLYNKDSGTGLYLASHDGQGYRKFLGVAPQPASGGLQYTVTQSPTDVGAPAEDYHMTYDMVMAPFHGDWYDASQMYRKWALQQQWASKGPLTTRDDIPTWYKQAPVMLIASSKGGTGAVYTSRERALEALSFFGTELPVIWYGWKEYDPQMTAYDADGSPWQGLEPENVHDGNYPYLPAKSNFATAGQAISDAGGHVLPYVNAYIYDPGIDENAPLAAQAKPNVVIDADGQIQFAEGGQVGAWVMDHATAWWQQRMADTVAALINNEHAGGIYFDTFYGGRIPWAPGSNGGGNGAYLSSVELALAVRAAMKAADPNAVIAGGEGSAETAVNVLDSILYVHGNMEENSIPMFAVVYGDYLPRYGLAVRPWKTAGFYVDSAAMFTEGAQMGRLSISERDIMDYPQEMGFMLKLANYWKPGVGQRYLAYGQLLRPIEFLNSSSIPTVGYIPSNADENTTDPFDVPGLLSGVFQAQDGSLGIFIVNVADELIPFDFELTPDLYPMILGSETYNCFLVDESGNRTSLGSQTGMLSLNGQVAAHDLLFFVMASSELPLLPGDANLDNVVSAADYASVQANFGSTGNPGIPGDANGDGVVSAADYASVQANFGNVAGTLSVPEPGAITLLILSGLAFFRRPRVCGTNSADFSRMIDKS